MTDTGWYRVMYPDGELTAFMPLKQARAYRSIFGGRISLHNLAPRWHRFLWWLMPE